MAAPVFGILLLQICTVGGSREVLSTFIYSHWYEDTVTAGGDNDGRRGFGSGVTQIVRDDCFTEVVTLIQTIMFS